MPSIKEEVQKQKKNVAADNTIETQPQSGVDYDKKKTEDAEIVKKRELAKKRPQLINVQVKHVFSDPERLQLGSQTVRALQEINELDGQMKSVASDYKSRIKVKQTLLEELANKQANGFEMREREVLVFFKPKERTRFLFDKDSGEFIRTEEMQPVDFQMSLLPELDKKYVEGNSLSPKKMAEIEEILNDSFK